MENDHSFAPALISSLIINAGFSSLASLLARANRRAVQPSLFLAFRFVPDASKDPMLYSFLTPHLRDPCTI